MVKIWIKKILFKNGIELEFEKKDKVVIVGPNNSGKTTILREITQLAANPNYQSKIIERIEFGKEGTEDDFVAFIDNHSIVSNNQVRSGYKFSLNIGSVKNHWSSIESNLGGLNNVFIMYLNTETRMDTIKAPQNIPIVNSVLTHPIHFLQKYDSNERRISDLFKKAFGLDLVLHRNAGSKVPLYVGNRPSPQSGEDRVSESYLERLEQLDELEGQGDGMKSFTGILLNSLETTHSIFLIDEPDIFLHPPQSYLLGKMIPSELYPSKQIFISTHSQEFLKGLLNSGNENLKIIRIEREGDNNLINEIDENIINSIWADSLLRHSNILSGLFHTKVIICESDSDCRFYSAILETINELNETVAPDLLFVHCGGKHRVPTVIKAMIKLNVKITVVVDIDILNNREPLKTIFEELGGDWSAIESDFNVVKASIDQKRPELIKEDLKSEIDSIFESFADSNVPVTKIKDIKQLLKKASAWSQAKSSGKSYVPSGDATISYERLISKLQERGILVPEVGELEGFDKSEGGHGPKWVSHVLQKDLTNVSIFQKAHDFVSNF